MDSSAQWTSQELGEVGKLSMGGEISSRENSRKVMSTRPQKEQIMALNCPRCHSTNTKFCYYNNYSLSQPRYFCKTCRRYWTEGGTLRNVPVGGGSRKNKRSYSSKHLNPKIHEDLHDHPPPPPPQFPAKMERSMHATSSSSGIDFLRSTAGAASFLNNIPAAGIMENANIYAAFEECKAPAAADQHEYGQNMFALGSGGSKRINEQHKQNPNGLLFWNIGMLGGGSSPW